MNGTTQTQGLELRTPGGTPYLDFSDDAASDFDARIIYSGADDHLEIRSTGANFTGNVGVGTTTPTRGRLEVIGISGDTTNLGAFAFFNPGTGASIIQNPNDANSIRNDIGIYATHAVAAGSFYACSDARIKIIAGRSDAAADLAALRQIEITDYTHKDTVTKSRGPVKKVIAQQVEAVFPQAVSRATDVVPDIYRRATTAGGWVELATDLRVGERVRILGEKEEGIYEVLEVREGAFRTAFQPAGGDVFVYGREVKDFRTVDYDAIAMLNVSATQELARRSEDFARQLEARDAEIAALRERLAALETGLAARLARLEAAGDTGSSPATAAAPAPADAPATTVK